MCSNNPYYFYVQYFAFFHLFFPFVPSGLLPIVSSTFIPLLLLLLPPTREPSFGELYHLVFCTNVVKGWTQNNMPDTTLSN